jgi:protein MpaA
MSRMGRKDAGASLFAPRVRVHTSSLTPRPRVFQTHSGGFKRKFAGGMLLLGASAALGAASPLAEKGALKANEVSEIHPVLRAPDPADIAPEGQPTQPEKIKERDEKALVRKLCEDIDALYKRNKWAQKSNCLDMDFSVVGWSVKGRPLINFEKDGPAADPVPAGQTAPAKKLTLIQCGIHGDELPSLYMCLSFIEEIMGGKRLPKGMRVAVQPLLNPDGMLGPKPTRHNANKVDINRNFPADDWEKTALASWKKKDGADPRKFPGKEPNSEPETHAIVEYINRMKPQKILAIHTPLGFLDLDAHDESGDHKRRAKYLAVNMVKNSGNYKFISFGVFPGSLGNYAGRGMRIPVYTLELPHGTSRPTVDSYWKKFRVSLWRAVDFDLDTGMFIED